MIDLHAARWISKDRYEVRGDARRFENWECNIASKIAMGVAVDYALELGLGAIYERVRALAGTLRERLSEIPGVTVCDIGVERCGIVTFTVEGQEPEAIKNALAAKKINVTISTRFSTRIDMEARGLDAMVRASVHYYNSEDEVERFATEIAALA